MIFIVSLLLCVSAYAGCINFIAESEIPRAIALEPNAGSKRCGKDDPCICFDGVDWETAAYNDKTKKFSVDASKAEAKRLRLANESQKAAQKRAEKLSTEARLKELKQKQSLSKEELEELPILLLRKNED